MATHGSIAAGESPATVVPPSVSPKGVVCLCSPTTHQGSFRCRFHRSQSSSSAAWMKRSKSMPVGKGGSSNSSSSVTSLSPKSIEST